MLTGISGSSDQDLGAVFVQNTDSLLLFFSETSPLPVLVVDTNSDNNVWLSFDLVQQRLAIHKSIDELFPSEAQELIEEGMKSKENLGRLK